MDQAVCWQGAKGIGSIAASQNTRKFETRVFCLSQCEATTEHSHDTVVVVLSTILYALRKRGGNVNLPCVTFQPAYPRHGGFEQGDPTNLARRQVSSFLNKADQSDLTRRVTLSTLDKVFKVT